MILETILKTIITILFMLILTKIIGSRQISQLTLYDYIVGITIGSIAAEICISDEIPIYIGLISLAIWGIITICLAILTNKSLKLRKLLSGVPVLIMEKGKIIEKNLKKVRLDVNDLLRELRIKNYFNIEEIEYVYFESNGKLSILPFDENKPSTKKDNTSNFQENSLTTCLIIDGKIVHENLKSTKKDNNWLAQELNKKNQELKNIILGIYNGSELITYEKSGN